MLTDPVLALLNDRVAEAAEAWLTDPTDAGVYQRLLLAVAARRAHLRETPVPQPLQRAATPDEAAADDGSVGDLRDPGDVPPAGDLLDPGVRAVGDLLDPSGVRAVGDLLDPSDVRAVGDLLDPSDVRAALDRLRGAR